MQLEEGSMSCYPTIVLLAYSETYNPSLGQVRCPVVWGTRLSFLEVSFIEIMVFMKHFRLLVDWLTKNWRGLCRQEVAQNGEFQMQHLAHHLQRHWSILRASLTNSVYWCRDSIPAKMRMSRGRCDLCKHQAVWPAEKWTYQSPEVNTVSSFYFGLQ